MEEYAPLTPTSIPSPTTSSKELYNYGLQYPPTPKQHKSNCLPESSNHAATLNSSNPPLLKLLGIPQTGAKSRVETQIKIILQLENIPNNQWNFIRLPYGSASKKRSKRGAPMPYDVPRHNTLYLETQVNCATAPYCPVYACSPCKEREKKRFQRKRDARRRPRSKSDDEGQDDALLNSAPLPVKDQWERNKITLFNCGELVPLSEDIAYEGAQPLPTAVLPTRVTCYCRHHREKTGFTIGFTLKQHDGSVVASNKSPPIMITDDHKTSTGKTSNYGEQSSIKCRNPLKSTRGIKDDALLAQSDTNDRKPYTRNTRRQNSPLEINLANSSSQSFVSPSDYSMKNALNTTPSTTPSPPRSIKKSLIGDLEGSAGLPKTLEESLVKFEHTDELETYLTSSLSVQSPIQLNDSANTLDESNSKGNNPTFDSEVDKYIESSWVDDGISRNESINIYNGPKISRVVPFEGPTRGGTEITILGQHFPDGLTVYFGSNAASRVTRWGECTLVCLLPPSSKPGTVSVSLRGYNTSDEQHGDNPLTFTYIDESDKALMELALKVLGYNLTGKYEDARNVAMRIVGTENGEGQVDDKASNTLSATNFDLEAFTINALRLLDYRQNVDSLNLLNKQRQTILHLSCQLSMVELTQSLIECGADVNARDINGFTPLHFAYISKSENCARMLYNSGADVEVVNACGISAKELGELTYSNKLLIQDSEDADDEINFSSAEDDSSLDDRVSKSNLLQSNDRGTIKDLENKDNEEEIGYQEKALEVFLTNLSTKLSEKTGWNPAGTTSRFTKVEMEANGESLVDEEDWSTRAKKRAQSVVEDVRLMLFWAPVLLLSLVFSFISIAPFINRVGNQLAPLLGLQANSE
ncbi:hypothetical protein E3P81_03276 [Wallemia ichthyophaga]|nr:hypothetical protein E3P97_03343 [Wallemia ichthyophaga]TIB02979.1 hypothetical protein E3P96_02019 [Wallemia ichthyophaga]TIB28511.1 hypothetical protein E3P85_03633 [Wallemia ichthyophaga]TIB44865.1 hypothetical protein E3P82_03311 [Wallemia ichthyophaga]TIB47404.1 hypothetical protein E3P81_03276 [Wallemia ichthyophaga]